MLWAIAGLFDFSAGSEFVGMEIVKCIGLAKDGIHAVLVGFSVRSRFPQEEEAALHSWQTLFGKKVFDYMIVVFTGGDELEDNEETLEDYLGRECPKPLKVCFWTAIVFDNFISHFEQVVLGWFLFEVLDSFTVGLLEVYVEKSILAQISPHLN